MAKKTPALHARGVYELKTPWVISQDVIYSCQAIRTFRDIYELGIDVFKTYYEPMGLDSSAFMADTLENANIITLIADNYTPSELDGGTGIIYVPDTYILKYPDQTNVPYSHTVLSISFGPLPDSLNLGAVKLQLANVASDTIGVVPTVNEHRAASTGVVTPTQYADNETARLGAIVIMESDYAKVKRLETENAKKDATIASLIAILEANSLWPPP